MSAPSTRVPAVAAATQLVAAGTKSVVSIFNDASTTLYVLLGGTATVSATNYTVQINTGGYWEMPQIGSMAAWEGDVTGIWAGSPTGGAQVTVL